MHLNINSTSKSNQMKRILTIRFERLFLATVLVLSLIGRFIFSKSKLSVYAAYSSYCTPKPKVSCQSTATGTIYDQYQLVQEGETFVEPLP